MIKVFKPNDRTFETNGDKILTPLKAVITKEDNGDYSLELETQLADKDYIEHGNIIAVDTPWGVQGFRIYNPQKKSSKITATCKHLYFDAENYLIADSYVVDKTCNDALDHLNNATEPTSPFTTISDVMTVDSYRCVRTSLAEAISEVINRWGGHLIRNNFDIQVRQNIGQDNGVTLRYGKNIQDITSKEDWSKVVTQIMPIGKERPDGEVLLPEVYITTADIDTADPNYNKQYDIPYTKAVNFTQSLEKEDGETDEDYTQALIEDLRSQAIEYITKNCVPQVSYSIKAQIDRITDVGDIIQVFDERLGVSLQTNVLSVKWDAIQEKYTEVNFGNFTNQLKNLISNVTSDTTQQVESTVTNKVIPQVQNQLEIAYQSIWNAMQNSYVIYDGNEILIVDALPKEDATNCIKINSGGIAFSNSGIYGQFISAWTIDGTFNAQAVNIINLVADVIKGGTLKLGSQLQQQGALEVYNEANRLIGKLDSSGLIMYANDASYIKINNQVGFAGYDKNGNKIYWVDQNEFHQANAVIENEMTVGGKLRLLPIQIDDGNGNITNNGIGFVAIFEE